MTPSHIFQSLNSCLSRLQALSHQDETRKEDRLSCNCSPRVPAPSFEPHRVCQWQRQDMELNRLYSFYNHSQCQHSSLASACQHRCSQSASHPHVQLPHQKTLTQEREKLAEFDGMWHLIKVKSAVLELVPRTVPEEQQQAAHQHQRMNWCHPRALLFHTKKKLKHFSVQMKCHSILEKELILHRNYCIVFWLIFPPKNASQIVFSSRQAGGRSVLKSAAAQISREMQTRNDLMLITTRVYVEKERRHSYKKVETSVLVTLNAEESQVFIICSFLPLEHMAAGAFLTGLWQSQNYSPSSAPQAGNPLEGGSVLHFTDSYLMLSLV